MPIDKDIIKYGLIALGIVTGLILLLVVINKFGKKSGAETVNEAKKQINKAQLTYTPATYQNFAERLLRAMKGPGTDEKAVLSVIEMLKTNADWYAIVVAFGVQKSGTFESSLIGWLQDELSTADFARIKQHLAKLEVYV